MAKSSGSTTLMLMLFNMLLQKLQKLWEKAEKSGLTSSELLALQEEFSHHQEKVGTRPVYLQSTYRIYLEYQSVCPPQSNELTRGPPELVQHFRL
jgi:hypothetical protein